jgi:hypothetical protein
MHKYDAHACTDVTGFGILGHAQNLVVTQLKDVDFVLHTLPIVRDMEKIDKKIHDFKLLEGFSGALPRRATPHVVQYHAAALTKLLPKTYGL